MEIGTKLNIFKIQKKNIHTVSCQEFPLDKDRSSTSLYLKEISLGQLCCVGNFCSCNYQTTYNLVHKSLLVQLAHLPLVPWRQRKLPLPKQLGWNCWKGCLSLLINSQGFPPLPGVSSFTRIRGGAGAATF
jgi:hypothetical protein